MKFSIRIVLALCSMLLLFNSCSNEPAKTEDAIYQCPMECEEDKTYSEEGSCPVCKMDLKPIADEPIQETGEVSDESIFNLTSKWKTEENETIVLEDLRGNVLVVVMIYTTCKAACPRLVADMRNIHDKVEESSVRYILVSIDPENDTPERLKAFAIENQMDGEEWTFLQGTVDDVREFSNVLAVKYKQISPLDFSHSNIISAFDESGVLRHQQEGLGVDNAALVAELKKMTES
ncbi:MAG: SCO family protein [Flavobacteriales bacterium]